MFLEDTENTTYENEWIKGYFDIDSTSDDSADSGCLKSPAHQDNHHIIPVKKPKRIKSAYLDPEYKKIAFQLHMNGKPDCILWRVYSTETMNNLIKQMLTYPEHHEDSMFIDTNNTLSDHINCDKMIQKLKKEFEDFDVAYDPMNDDLRELGGVLSNNFQILEAFWLKFCSNLDLSSKFKAQNPFPPTASHRHQPSSLQI